MGNFDARSGSMANISGGSFSDPFDAFEGSEVNILGSEFFIDGLELTDLLLDESFTITDRNVTLSGLPADREQFSFNLIPVNTFLFDDFFSSGATLTVTATTPVPEPSSSVFISLALAMGLLRRRRD